MKANSPLAPADDLLNTRIEAARRELLDLSLRNPLLNFRPSKVQGVSMVREEAAAVFEVLVRQGKTMYFQAVPESRQKGLTKAGLPSDESLDLFALKAPAPDSGTENEEVPAGQSEMTEAERQTTLTDNKLQTDETPARLEARLLNTTYAARTSLEETGVNILYLALGMLTWYEADNSEDARQAPLVLVPVLLERGMAAERFKLRYTSAEVEGNLSLQAKLLADFGVALPLPEVDEDGRLESYYATVAAAVAGRPRWEVTIDRIALGFFSFAKLAMYSDLDGAKWPANAGLRDHPAIQALLGTDAGFRDRPPTVGEHAFLDTESPAAELHQVLDADSSQLLALLAVHEGRNLVIQGPPGTGKSQTIANLLAEAIGAGKKVLFVAEKMAALEVVKRRLDMMGLGAACLELHSHKANKKALLEELRATLNLGRPAVPPVLNDQMAQLPRYRQELNNYARIVNQPVGHSRFTAQQVTGKLLEIQQAQGEVALPRIAFQRLEQWTDDDATRAETLADRLAATLRRVGTPRELLFWGSELLLLLPADQLHLAALLLPAQAAVTALQQAGSALATLLQQPLPTDRAAVEALLPGARQTLREARVAYTPTAASAIEALVTASAALAAVLGLSAPTDRAAAQALSPLTHHAQQTPPLAGIAVADPAWAAALPTLRELQQAGTTWQTLHTRFESVLLPEAWQQQLTTERGALLTYGGKWWNFLSGDYRRARQRLQSIWRGPLPKEAAQLTAAVEAINEAARSEQLILAGAGLAGRLFGPTWQGVRTDWSAAAEIIDFLSLTHQRIARQELPAGLMRGLAATPTAEELATNLRALETALAQQQAALLTVVEVLLPPGNRIPHLDQQLVAQPFHTQLTALAAWQSTLPHPDALATRLAAAEAALPPHRAALQAVADALQLNEVRRFGPEGRLQFQLFPTQHTTLAAWQADLPAVQQTIEWNNVAAAARQEQVPELVELAERWPLAGQWLAAATRQTWFEFLQRQAHTQHPELRQFERAGHEEVAARFRQADRDSLLHNRVRAMRYHFDQLPNQQGGGQMLTLKNEFARKRGHMPIRKLMQQAGRAIQAIKPVFMMSPLSVANFLPPEAADFDLVVFDEASQVKPVDALGAIGRGRQLVVVGDSKQLPPSSFFDSLTGASAPDEEGNNVTADIQSILELVASKLPNSLSLMLRWHYRSLHQSLIAASNHLFYENKLVIFPSPGGQGQLGLVYHHLPNTHYERGTTRTNPLEAAAVADAVMQHARTTPKLTLGVVAFSVVQRQAIQDALELRRKQYPETEAFFNRHPHEPFFIKNLENVQGDERDVILISLGYGRTADGYLSMSFGPLNGEGGERRLNVLITRAKQRCEVFTNLTADDLDLARTKAKGVAALKTFLHFAQFGRLNQNEETGREMESPFEEAVYRALTAQGYTVRPQIGSQGFYLDLAVVDPDQPGRYVLGIECDGAMYHSAKSARDRDRLRQQVLEAVGWRLHRIWSTDWFRDPARETARAVAAIEEARQLAARDEPEEEEEPEMVPTVEAPAFEREEAAAENGLVAVPYVVAQVPADILVGEFHLHPVGRIAQWLTEVVRVESPVHIDEVARRLAYAAGLKSLGSRIRASAEAGATLAGRTGRLRRQGDFLWLAGMQQPEVRDRTTAPDTTRKLALVAPEEIGEAIKTVVRHSFTIDRQAVASPTLRLLGFLRVTEEARLQIEAVVAKLVQTNQLTETNGLLQL